jgi:hypothetical protein
LPRGHDRARRRGPLGCGELLLGGIEIRLRLVACRKARPTTFRISLLCLTAE